MEGGRGGGAWTGRQDLSLALILLLARRLFALDAFALALLLQLRSSWQSVTKRARFGGGLSPAGKGRRSACGGYAEPTQAWGEGRRGWTCCMVRRWIDRLMPSSLAAAYFGRTHRYLRLNVRFCEYHPSAAASQLAGGGMLPLVAFSPVR